MFYETNLDMNSQDFKPSYSALQIGDEQLTLVYCVLLGVAVVIFICCCTRVGCCTGKASWLLQMLQQEESLGCGSES